MLLDLQQSTEVARIAIGDLLAGAPSNYTLGLSLDTDGTLAASVPVEPQIVWTAVDDPTRHSVAARTRSTAIALAGGLLAVSREDAKAVIELRTEPTAGSSATSPSATWTSTARASRGPTPERSAASRGRAIPARARPPPRSPRCRSGRPRRERLGRTATRPRRSRCSR